jgi:hypothetical protein
MRLRYEHWSSTEAVGFEEQTFWTIKFNFPALLYMTWFGDARTRCVRSKPFGDAQPVEEPSLEECASRVISLWDENIYCDGNEGDPEEAVIARGRDVCLRTLECMDNEHSNPGDCWKDNYFNCNDDCNVGAWCRWTGEYTYECMCQIDSTSTEEFVPDCAGDALSSDICLEFCLNSAATLTCCP